MPRMSTTETSLTIDCLMDGRIYDISFSCPVDDGSQAVSRGSFTDKFVGFSLGNDGRLYTVWAAQDAIWVWHITFIRIARHRD